MHLSDYMAKNRLSDEEVASSIGRDRATVSRIRRKKIRPNWETIEKIRTFTGDAVTADDFVQMEAAE
jgi:transcriptional regulator with XRE-family HTH domain